MLGWSKDDEVEVGRWGAKEEDGIGEKMGERDRGTRVRGERGGEGGEVNEEEGRREKNGEIWA